MGELPKFQVFDTDAFEAVLGTDFFAQNEWIRYLSLQEPTHLLFWHVHALPCTALHCPAPLCTAHWTSTLQPATVFAGPLGAR